MLPMTPRNPFKHGGETCFEGVFQLKGQDNCTASKDDGRGHVPHRALKPAMGIDMGRGWVFQQDNVPKHTAQGNKEWPQEEAH